MSDDDGSAVDGPQAVFTQQRLDPSARRATSSCPTVRCCQQRSDERGDLVGLRLRRFEQQFVVNRENHASRLGLLRDFASASLGLRKVAEVDGYDLLVPRTSRASALRPDLMMSR